MKILDLDIQFEYLDRLLQVDNNATLVVQKAQEIVEYESCDLETRLELVERLWNYFPNKNVWLDLEFLNTLMFSIHTLQQEYTEYVDELMKRVSIHKHDDRLISLIAECDLNFEIKARFCKTFVDAQNLTEQGIDWYTHHALFKKLAPNYEQLLLCCDMQLVPHGPEFAIKFWNLTSTLSLTSEEKLVLIRKMLLVREELIRYSLCNSQFLTDLTLQENLDLVEWLLKEIGKLNKHLQFGSIVNSRLNSFRVDAWSQKQLDKIQALFWYYQRTIQTSDKDKYYFFKLLLKVLPRDGNLRFYRTIFVPSFASAYSYLSNSHQLWYDCLTLAVESLDWYKICEQLSDYEFYKTPGVNPITIGNLYIKNPKFRPLIWKMFIGRTSPDWNKTSSLVQYLLNTGYATLKQVECENEDSGQ